MQIEAIDDLLWHVNQLICDLQPHKHGRVSIKTHSNDPFLRPYPTVWRISKVDKGRKSDKKGRERMPMLAKKSREFSDNYDLVFELLQIGQKLMDDRAALILSVTNFKQSVSQKKSRISERAAALRDRIHEVTADRDAGKFITFITKHKPARQLD